MSRSRTPGRGDVAVRAAFLAAMVTMIALMTSPVGAADIHDESDEDFVRAAYEDLLGREPEVGGLEFWLDRLERGVPRTEVVAGIGDSTEHRERVVASVYRELLDRAPDDGGLGYWTGQLTDRLGSDGLRARFLGSEEFYDRAGGSDSAFVTQLYRRVLEREPDPGGRGFWLQRLRDGQARVAVARGFLASPERTQHAASFLEADPSPEALVDSIDEVWLRFDRPVDARASAILLSVDGQRIPGITSGPTDRNDTLRFVPTTRPRVDVGRSASAVVTTFVFDGSTIRRHDHEFTYRPSATSIPPGDDLMVAFYGHPTAPVLGIGGEGTPAQALGRLLEQAAPYQDSGRTVVPTFEMIATLVTVGPGDDGLYRTRAAEASLREYLDTVRTVSGRLVLDIQPGRADVLAEARAHEPLLIEPEVGLALDPEWVVGPDQTPRGRIGSLDAAEINRVSLYLSRLVEAHALPPKILIIHRFRADMVTNPEAIISPPGVRIIFQADGEGGQGAKIGDYDTLLPTRFERGIKIFYDEDTNRLTPEDVLTLLDPLPVYVSYQ